MIEEKKKIQGGKTKFVFDNLSLSDIFCFAGETGQRN